MMHLELRHLRTIRALHEQGSLQRAADVLHITQSALSHQIKALEDQAGTALVVRRTKPMRLSAAGLRLLRLAGTVLPQVAATEAEFRGVEMGRIGRLHVGMECPACLDWLVPVLDETRRAWPEVDIDIRQRGDLAGVPALLREAVDVVLTSDPDEPAGVAVQPLFDYAPTLIVPAGHRLAARGHAEPADLAGETVIHYPLNRSRLDVFAGFLDPAGVAPAASRAVEVTAVAVMLVAAGRGVAVLPDWALAPFAGQGDIAQVSLGRGGLRRRMHAAVRADDLGLPYLAHWLRLARGAPARMGRRG